MVHWCGRPERAPGMLLAVSGARAGCQRLGSALARGALRIAAGLMVRCLVARAWSHALLFPGNTLLLPPWCMYVVAFGLHQSWLQRRAMCRGRAASPARVMVAAGISGGARRQAAAALAAGRACGSATRSHRQQPQPAIATVLSSFPRNARICLPVFVLVLVLCCSPRAYRLRKRACLLRMRMLRRFTKWLAR